MYIHRPCSLSPYVGMSNSIITLHRLQWSLMDSTICSAQSAYSVSNATVIIFVNEPIPDKHQQLAEASNIQCKPHHPPYPPHLMQTLPSIQSDWIPGCCIEASSSAELPSIHSEMDTIPQSLEGTIEHSLRYSLSLSPIVFY